MFEVERLGVAGARVEDTSGYPAGKPGDHQFGELVRVDVGLFADLAVDVADVH